MAGEAVEHLDHDEALVEVDYEARARRAQALSHVRKLGDPVLRTTAVKVSQFDDHLRDEIARMGELMNDAQGIGLAATQVGVAHRVLVYRVQSDTPTVALVNPKVEWRGKEQEIIEEGCLSLPGIHVEVERPVYIRVSAQDEFGVGLTIEAAGLEARVIQRELDHLDGVLILDRTTREQRREAMRAWRESLQ